MNATAVKCEKMKQEVDKSKIRRWILKSVSETTPKTAVTLHAIKKFLDTKESGLSNNPETKLVIKRLTESGHLVKIEGRFADGKILSKDKMTAQKSKSGNESKSLAKGSVIMKQPPAQKRKMESESKDIAKDSVIVKQPPAQKRKIGSELKNLGKSNVTEKQPPVQKAKSVRKSINITEVGVIVKQPPAQKRKIGSESKIIGKDNVGVEQPTAEKRKIGRELKNLCKSNVTDKLPAQSPPSQKAKNVSESNNPAKVGVIVKQPTAEKRKIGSELKNLAEGNATSTDERKSTKKAKPQESDHLMGNDGKSLDGKPIGKNNQPPAQKLKSDTELTNLATGSASATCLAENSSANESSEGDVQLKKENQ